MCVTWYVSVHMFGKPEAAYVDDLFVCFAVSWYASECQELCMRCVCIAVYLDLCMWCTSAPVHCHILVCLFMVIIASDTL